MEFAIQTRATDEGIDTLELARTVEGMGFEALFCADHPHIPVDRQSSNPARPDDFHAREYLRLLDPFVNLAAIASVTTTLKLGTSICLVVEREPILLAKQVATLDHMSKGRFIFGIGSGWNREEMLNVGTDPRTRLKLMEERVLAMKEMWTKEEAEFHGKFVNFNPIYSWPKPVQKPHPPVLIGGSGPTVLERVIRYGDGWIPGLGGIVNNAGEEGASVDPIAVLGERMTELARLAKEAGRETPPVTLQVPIKPDGPFLTFDKLANLGLARLIIQISAGPTERTLHELRQVHEAVRAFRGY